ncbi:ABC transporter substrate-binding protein, partial [bacterium]|nr:ABC transporter substrate-binding protein [bacterium]
PSLAVIAMHKLISIDRVPVVLGFSSGETLAMAATANRTKTVLLAPMASAAAISNAGDFVFRLSPSDAFQSNVLADVLENDGRKKIAVLYVNNDWGKGLTDALTARLKELNLPPLQIVTSNPEDKDFRAQLQKIKLSSPDALVIFLHPNEAIHAIRQIREIRLDCSLYGGDTFSVDAIYQTIPKLAQGIVFTLPAKPDSPTFTKFATAYRHEFNENPDINAAVGYDAVKLLAHIMKQGHTTGPAIRKALLAIKDYPGASGTITFAANGDVVSKHYDVMVIGEGVYRERD